MIAVLLRAHASLQTTLPAYFVESWTYSSALSVVEQCNIWANGFKLEAPQQAAFNARKGELIELARNQVISPECDSFQRTNSF